VYYVRWNYQTPFSRYSKLLSLGQGHHFLLPCCTIYQESCISSSPHMSFSTGQPCEFNRLLGACSWTHGTFSLSSGSWNAGPEFGTVKEFDSTGCAWDNGFWPWGNPSERYWRLSTSLLSALIGIAPFGCSTICPATRGIKGGCS
jgi:hypothetical protein